VNRTHQPEGQVGLKTWIQSVGLFAGPLLAGLCLWWLPSAYTDVSGQLISFSWAGRATLAVLVWMAVWWLTEAIEMSATALLPVVLFPLLDIAPIKKAAASYADPMIFLFIGSFILALSIQRWGLDRRMALVTLRLVGTRPANMVAGFMLVTAALSAFISNTATTAMMLPIALSVISLRRFGADQEEREDFAGVSAAKANASTSSQRSADYSDARKRRNFSVCLLLGIAYASSIGGVATIIGTPPNVFLMGFLNNTIAEPYRIEISFFRWLMIGVPFSMLFLPIAWLALTRFIFPISTEEVAGGKELIQTEYLKLGSLSWAEKATFLVFGCTATGWMFSELLRKISFTIGGELYRPLAGLTDANIAMLAALALFLIPAKTRLPPTTVNNSPKQPRFVMDWKTAEKLPWGILILFGGGLSLAAAVEANGVAEFFGTQARYFSGIHEFWIVLAVCIAVVYLTELTTNIATTATLLPIFAAIAPSLGVHPYVLVIPTAIASSCAFMLPIATGPNAIIFSSGQIEPGQMMRAGFWFNIVSVVITVMLAFMVIKPFLGV
jgi:sodium-dependent dicarboxylate transporter 2/3/5